MTGNLARWSRFSVTVLRCCLAGLCLGGPWAGGLLARDKTPPPPKEQQWEFFEKHVRPVLARRCVKCHGPKKQEGGLRLDSRQAMLQGGDSGPAVVPGHPDKGFLVDAIRYGEVYQMPPDGKLPPEQVQAIVRWIAWGAPWPQEPKRPERAAEERTSRRGEYPFDFQQRARHWAFRPLWQGPLPEVADQAWPRQVLDRFVLARLEAQGLRPSRPAEPAVWLRRVTLELTGLPPTVEQLEQFLADPSPTARARVVDRLLASPEFGQRWARHWLDLVRFAETMGHEFDFEIPGAWAYRDYCIRAFNADVPYDQFFLEHVAGDLLPRPRRHPVRGFNESILGTAFFFLHQGKHSPVDVRAEEADRMDNQIDVLGKTFFALTLACARCHEHKFDPISIEEYYALCGYLQSSRRHLMPLCDERPLNRLAEQLTRLEHQRQRLLRQEKLRQVQAVLAELRRAGKEARAGNAPTAENAAPTKPVGGELPEYFRLRRGWQGWFVTGQAFGAGPVWEPWLDEQGRTRGFPVPVAHSGLVSSRLQGTLRSRTFVIEKPWLHVLLAGREAQFQVILAGFHLIRNPIYGHLKIQPKDDRFRWYAVDLSKWVGQRAYLELLDLGEGYIALGGARWSDTPELPSPGEAPAAPEATTVASGPGGSAPAAEKLLQRWACQPGSLSPDQARQVAALLQWAKRAGDGSPLPKLPPEVTTQLRRLAEQKRRLDKRLRYGPRVVVMVDGNGVDEHLFVRGNHKALGPLQPRRLPRILGGKDQPPPPPEGSGRLQMAQRALEHSGHLMARVVVNRVWHHMFGRGLVASVDNFGHLGARPTHPELLDYLAAELIRHRWSLKWLIRQIALSATYAQTSAITDPRAEQVDPQNLLLHRMNLQRLEAEAIRDSILAVSGRLDRQKYEGPGVLPHLTPFMQGRGRPDRSGPLDGNGWRSIYINVRRNFLTPMFLAFDYPVPMTTVGRRSTSNVPAQALTMLNDPFVLQQAQVWAARLLARSGDDSQRVQRMFLEAVARKPTPRELQAALAFLEEAAPGSNQQARLGAWTQLCHAVLNMKEFVFIP